MIKVIIKKDNHIINKVVISGHANYDESGKDIVCAAVSATVITTVNAIGRLNKEVLECIQDDNKITLIIKKHDATVNALIENMISMLKEIELDYSKYIKINEEV